MAVRPSVRFEVLKRDNMTCRYCGRSAPDVKLHVDHIIPQAAGGSDDPSNLATACVDCNAGKGARMLAEGQIPGVHAAALAEAQRRAEQMRQYREAQEQLERETGALLNRVWEHWTETFGGRKTEDGGWRCEINYPSDATVRRYLVDLPLDVVLKAIDVARWRYDNPNPERGPLAPGDVRKYFSGVCTGKLKDLSGTRPQRPEPTPEPVREPEPTVYHPRVSGWYRVSEVLSGVYDGLDAAYGRAHARTAA